MPYVPLFDYHTPVQAELAKALLNSNGIRSRVSDTDVLQTTLGRVTLYVAADQAPKARELLGLEAPAAAGPPRRETTQERVQRAFRAALVAFVVLPGLVHAYSLWLLSAVSPWGLRGHVQRLYLVTLAIDVLILAPAGWLLAAQVF